MAVAVNYDYPKHYAKQQYLPDEIADRTFYHPVDHGYELKIRQYFAWIHGEETKE